MKCISCGNESIEKIDKSGKELYLCSNGHEEERIIKNEGLATYELDQEIIHRSVGAVITQNNKLLLLKRRKYPYKYSIPAGHLEESEDSKKAVSREVREETGIKKSPEEFKEIRSDLIEDKCRRGADRHDWNLYSLKLDSKPELDKNDEAEKLVWVKPNNLASKELTAPTQKFLGEIYNYE